MACQVDAVLKTWLRQLCIVICALQWDLQLVEQNSLQYNTRRAHTRQQFLTRRRQGHYSSSYAC